MLNNQPQFVHNFQQPTYNVPIIPQNPVYGQPHFQNNYTTNQFTQPLYNNTTVGSKPMVPHFQNQWIQPQSQQIQSVPYNVNQSYPDYSMSAPQPQYIQSFSSNPAPNVNYPQNVPVVNNETSNVGVPYYEESETQFQHDRKFVPGSPTKRRFDFKLELKKKKRTVLASNLHEVKTVDVAVFEVSSVNLIVN